MLVRDLPLLRTSRPFWHRPEPLTSVVQLDPEHAALRRLFPASWRHLVKVKSLLDCTAHLDVPSGFDEAEHETWVRLLLRDTARVLTEFATAELSVGNTATARQGERLADNIASYAEFGVWSAYTVHTPEPEGPWIYCGPLSTWARRDTRMPLTLLVTASEPALQRVVDTVTESLPTVRATAGSALGVTAVPIKPMPGMYTQRLLLAGGESALGHKNFAHFVPLETPSGTVVDAPFTVVFANVHRERLARCSLALLRTELGGMAEYDLQAVLEASLAWFRCHDIGHFWRAAGYTERGGLADVLTDFELMALQETYADSLGVVCATELWDNKYLAVAFFAELLRYLSRNAATFADSIAATIEIGWLSEHGIGLTSMSADLARRASDCLTNLVPLLHDALWSERSPDLDTILRMVDVGQWHARRLGPLYGQIPTDIIYTFG